MKKLLIILLLCSSAFAKNKCRVVWMEGVTGFVGHGHWAECSLVWDAALESSNQDAAIWIEYYKRFSKNKTLLIQPTLVLHEPCLPTLSPRELPTLPKITSITP